EQDVVLDVEDAGRLAGPLEELAEPEEVPGLAVRHRAVADARDQRIDLLDLAVEGAAVAVIEGPRLGALHPQVEIIHALPGLAADALADVAGVLSGGGDGAEDAGVVGRLPGQVILDAL